MVFVGGARQVDKTTFALSLLGAGSDESSPAYLNWDHLPDRQAILEPSAASWPCRSATRPPFVGAKQASPIARPL